jgi:hypothetical protein
MGDTNGRSREPTKGAEPTTAGTGPTLDAEPTESAESNEDADPGRPSRDEMSITFTPAQLAVGGAVVAGLVVVGIRLLLGRRRGRG